MCGRCWCVCANLSCADAAIYLLLFIYYFQQDLHSLVHITTEFNCAQYNYTFSLLKKKQTSSCSNVPALGFVAEVLKPLRKQMSTTVNCGGTAMKGRVHAVGDILSYFVQTMLMYSTWRVARHRRSLLNTVHYWRTAAILQH